MVELGRLGISHVVPHAQERSKTSVVIAVPTPLENFEKRNYVRYAEWKGATYLRQAYRKFRSEALNTSVL